MKIRIEDSKGVGVTATGLSDSMNREEIMDIVGGIHDMIRLVYKYENTSDKSVELNTENAYKAIEEVKKAVVKSSEAPLIRPRIPNNVVDIKDLSVKKAVTENALVRCPKCGQAHCLAVPSNGRIYMMRRNYLKKEFGIIAEFNSLESKAFVDACCKPDTDRQAYWQDLQNIPFRNDTDFAVNNETEIFCPVCCTSNQFNEWKNAFENPLHYFETEHICDACGGEKLEKLVKNRKVYQCDSCGLQSNLDKEDRWP